MQTACLTLSDAAWRGGEGRGEEREGEERGGERMGGEERGGKGSNHIICIDTQ